MKIFLVVMRYDYGDINRGDSYEYINFYQSLKSIGHEVILFDYITELAKLGRDAMNEKLLNMARVNRPQMTMFSLYTDQFKPEVIREISKYTKTLCFFHDDTWRVDFSIFWAKQFDFFSTPDVYGVKNYEKLGLHNAIYFPFGHNPNLYIKKDSITQYDVSFVGSWHPYRQWLLGLLKKDGWNVYIAGYRWPNGQLTHEEMINLFNKSKINLNMSNSTSWDLRYLLSSPRALLNTYRSPKSIEQIKARHFEISGCGGFQLSYYVDGLESLFQIGKEIAVYTTPDDLRKKVKII
jgi:spore maturation protein CgeB